ncbi:MAG TPA: MATE family efflux transporter [Thermoanaerobaculia bacterium]|nr:MATE family efflux transporter [Thermoanaerobaculia bacterium]
MTEHPDSAAPVAAPPPVSSSGAWATIREAIRGSKQDFTEGPIGRAIFLLAVPMVAEMLMESLFAVVDIFWVSKLGADAVATVGLTESLLALIYAVAIGLSMGATAMVARRIGEKDPEQAASTAVQAIALGIVLAIPIGIAGALLAPRLLTLMGASPSVVATGSGFTAIMLGSNVVILLLFLINAVFRGAGDAAIAMRVLWLANALNIVLGPCFIFGLGPFPELGVTGAAVGTCIGRGTGVLYQLWTLSRGGGRIAVGRRHLKLDPAVMLRLLRVSGSGILQAAIGTASWIGLVRILSTFGSAALAGYTIGIRIIVFAILPSWGMSNAAATMVGQSLGAGKPDRAERSVWIAGFYNMLFLGGVGLCFILFAGPLIRFFTQDPAIVPYGIDCLRIVSYGFLFYAYGMVLTAAFNGAGDTWTPTWINFFCFWLWEIPLAYVLATRAGMGPRGVFVAITIAFSTLAVVGALMFRRGKWKEKKV